MLRDLIDLIKQGKLREPIWEKVSWKLDAPEQDTQNIFRQAVDKGITGFGTGKQIIFFEQ